MNQGGGLTGGKYPVYSPDTPFQSELNAICRRGLESSCEVLRNMKLIELKNLCENPAQLDSLIEESHVGADLQSLVDEARERVIKEAQENLALEPMLEEVRQNVETGTQSLSTWKVKYEEASRKYERLCAKYNPHCIAKQLIESVATVDEESEKVAEGFLTGKKELDVFLEEYISRRTLSHSQKVKYEKLSNQLEKLHQAGF